VVTKMGFPPSLSLSEKIAAIVSQKSALQKPRPCRSQSGVKMKPDTAVAVQQQQKVVGWPTTCPVRPVQATVLLLLRYVLYCVKYYFTVLYSTPVPSGFYSM
jgi:hypothetical protein